MGLVYLAELGLVGASPAGNLLPAGEAPGLAPWVLSGATATAAAAVGPDGQATAVRFIESAANGFHVMRRDIAIAAGAVTGVEIAVKPNGRSRVEFDWQDTGYINRVRLGFDLVSGATVFSLVAGAARLDAAEAELLGDGWVRLFLAGRIDGVATTGRVQVSAHDGASASYAGDGTSGLFVALPSIVPRAVAPRRAGRLCLSYPAVRPFPPGDPERPNQEYEPRLIEPANVEIALYSDMTAGVGDIGGGAVVLANADGRHSYLRGYAVRSVDIRAGQDGDAWAQYAPVFSGAGGVPEVEVSTSSPSRVTIGVSDARAVLELAVDTGLYAGTNAGAAGYEGTAADLKGRPKPLALGDLSTANVPAVPVNGAGRAFQIHAGPVASITALYDRGGAAGLTLLGNFAGAAFDSAAPSATQYATDLNRGLLKLGGTLGGELTVDFTGDNTGGYVDTAPALIRRVLARRGVPAAKIGASFATVSAPAKVGLWTGTDGPRARDLIDTLCRSFLGWCVPDALGIWQIGQLEAPIGTPTLTLGADELLELEPDRFGAAVPCAEVRVLWGRNYRPMNKNEVAGAVATGQAARLAFLEAEYRTATWSSAENLARYGNAAPSYEVETALRLEADAVSLANAWGALFGVARQAYRVTVPLTPAVRDAPLGALVALEYPPLGISGLFRLVAWRPTSPKIHLATLRLWG